MSPQESSLQMWGGIECTVNRVGDHYLDQLELSGHASRISDLDLFSQLNLSAVRYPLLWERTEPNSNIVIDWRWSDERFSLLRERKIRPIVGLLHHGSGPRHTHLRDPHFADLFAEYAAKVASQYPWIDAYTPINEPLTTARFSGLYGHWYPHESDPCAFCDALLNECRASVLAMREIRKINPHAQLIQTEDLGKVHSTPDLAHQAQFENDRRWITWDLLCGHVDRHHPMHAHFLACGIPEESIEWFRENPCRPDVLGINYYVTSERFLDSRRERYPACHHGSNGRERYADIEAVRVLAEGIRGVEGVLREAWERYRLPMAITEVHLGCTREEQLRWLWEAYRGAMQARSDGIDVRAITAWSLLGAFDWDSLLTCQRGRYESGVFDIRSPLPRATAVADLVSHIAKGEKSILLHPTTDHAGWWRRDDRLIYAPVNLSAETQRVPKALSVFKLPQPTSRPLLITGGRGTLARAFSRICGERAIDHKLLGRDELDIAAVSQIRRAIQQFRPWAIVNAAGYVNVDAAEGDYERCMRENRKGPASLAMVCEELGVQLLTFSSDLVFDGTQDRAYREEDCPSPLNIYGLSKYESEKEVLRWMPSAFVVRTSAFFGPWDQANFVWAAIEAAIANRRFRAAHDVVISPTYVPDLVNVSLDLLIDRVSGIWHLCNEEPVSWAEFAKRALDMAGVTQHRLQECTLEELRLSARRPRFSALTSSKSKSLLPSLDDALYRYVRDAEAFSRSLAI